MLERPLLSALAMLLALPAPAAAEALTAGAPSVTVEGRPAATAGDAAAREEGSTTVITGSPDVFVNGKPAATVGDGTACGGAITGGARNVFVNGRPLARTGDPATGCTR